MVYLANHVEAVKAECLRRNEPGHYYTPEEIDNAIKAQIEDNLRYRKGRTYCNSFRGPASQYVSDIPAYESDEVCAVWEFSGYVRNSASRVKRGYPAIG